MTKETDEKLEVSKKELQEVKKEADSISRRIKNLQLQARVIRRAS